jgi:hypothetical protein
MGNLHDLPPNAIIHERTIDRESTKEKSKFQQTSTKAQNIITG